MTTAIAAKSGKKIESLKVNEKANCLAHGGRPSRHIKTHIIPKSTARTMTAASNGLLSQIQESPAKPPIFFEGGFVRFIVRLAKLPRKV